MKSKKTTNLPSQLGVESVDELVQDLISSRVVVKDSVLKNKNEFSIYKNGKFTQLHGHTSSRSIHSVKIEKAIRLIHASYYHSLTVETLANEAHMSVSSFHARFREIMHTSPMQYLKALRLHQALLLLVHQGLTVAVVATHVGYESASQFSREFKRRFGDSPRAEVVRVRQELDSAIGGRHKLFSVSEEIARALCLPYSSTAGQRTAARADRA